MLQGQTLEKCKFPVALKKNDVHTILNWCACFLIYSRMCAIRLAENNNNKILWRKIHNRLSRLSFNLHWITNLIHGYLPIYHTSKEQVTFLNIIKSQMPCLAAPTQYSICTYFLNAYTLRCQPEVFSAAQIMEDKETRDKNTTWKPFKICHSEALCTDRFSINPNSVQHIKPLRNGKEFYAKAEVS